LDEGAVPPEVIRACLDEGAGPLAVIRAIGRCALGAAGVSVDSESEECAEAESGGEGGAVPFSLPLSFFVGDFVDFSIDCIGDFSLSFFFFPSILRFFGEGSSSSDSGPESAVTSDSGLGSRLRLFDFEVTVPLDTDAC
jgi:hypothetical protein